MSDVHPEASDEAGGQEKIQDLRSRIFALQEELQDQEELQEQVLAGAPFFLDS